MRNIPKLVEIRNNRHLSPEMDMEFLITLKRGLLLSLKEKKILTTTQYRYAEEKMKLQRQAHARKKLEEL